MASSADCAQASEEMLSTETRAETVREVVCTTLDRLSEQWAAIEKKLVAMYPPRHVWISYAHADAEYHRPDLGTIYFCLGLVKFRGDWRLCHGRYVDVHDNEPESWKPVVDCSVEERVSLTKHVEKMRDAVIEAAEKSIPQVKEAADRLEQALRLF